VRYRLIAELVATRICWCRDCQHIAANGTVNVVVSSAELHIVATLSEYVRTAASGNQARRFFCPLCMCHLLSDFSGLPNLTVVRVSTLDAPSSITPAANIWSASAPVWACLDAAIERIEGPPTPPPTKRAA
jgi:hypothetical protein